MELPVRGAAESDVPNVDLCTVTSSTDDDVTTGIVNVGTILVPPAEFAMDQDQYDELKGPIAELRKFRFVAVNRTHYIRSYRNSDVSVLM